MCACVRAFARVCGCAHSCVHMLSAGDQARSACIVADVTACNVNGKIRQHTSNLMERKGEREGGKERK